MLTDIYVREKLNEMSREASRTQRVPAGGLGVPFAIPVARSAGETSVPNRREASVGRDVSSEPVVCGSHPRGESTRSGFVATD